VAPPLALLRDRNTCAGDELKLAYTNLTMGIFDKLFRSGPSNQGQPSPLSPPVSDGLPDKIAVKGLKDLVTIEFGEDDMDLPFNLWGHFDKALCHPWSNEIVLTSSRMAPPSLSQIRSLFDDLNAYFGGDGHGDGPFDRKDLVQWDQFREVQRLFYFYGENHSGIRYQKGQQFTPEDVLNKPSISVTIKRDVSDPEMDCEVNLRHWDKIKARYLA
jgi:hypothetical protein